MPALTGLPQSRATACAGQQRAALVRQHFKREGQTRGERGGVVARRRDQLPCGAGALRRDQVIQAAAAGAHGGASLAAWWLLRRRQPARGNAGQGAFDAGDGIASLRRARFGQRRVECGAIIGQQGGVERKGALVPQREGRPGQGRCDCGTDAVAQRGDAAPVVSQQVGARQVGEPRQFPGGSGQARAGVVQRAVPPEHRGGNAAGAEQRGVHVTRAKRRADRACQRRCRRVLVAKPRSDHAVPQHRRSRGEGPGRQRCGIQHRGGLGPALGTPVVGDDRDRCGGRSGRAAGGRDAQQLPRAFGRERGIARQQKQAEPRQQLQLALGIGLAGPLARPGWPSRTTRSSRTTRPSWPGRADPAQHAQGRAQRRLGCGGGRQRQQGAGLFVHGGARQTVGAGGEGEDPVAFVGRRGAAREVSQFLGRAVGLLEVAKQHRATRRPLRQCVPQPGTIRISQQQAKAKVAVGEALQSASLRGLTSAQVEARHPASLDQPHVRIGRIERGIEVIGGAQQPWPVAMDRTRRRGRSARRGRPPQCGRQRGMDSASFGATQWCGDYARDAGVAEVQGAGGIVFVAMVQQAQRERRRQCGQERPPGDTERCAQDRDVEGFAEAGGHRERLPGSAIEALAIRAQLLGVGRQRYPRQRLRVDEVTAVVPPDHGCAQQLFERLQQAAGSPAAALAQGQRQIGELAAIDGSQVRAEQLPHCGGAELGHRHAHVALPARATHFAGRGLIVDGTEDDVHACVGQRVECKARGWAAALLGRGEFHHHWPGGEAGEQFSEER